MTYTEKSGGFQNVVYSGINKLAGSITIRIRILGLFLAIIIAVIGIVAGTTYYIGKNNLESVTKSQLNNSVRFVENQIALLSGAYTAREFADKLEYILVKEQASFNEAGYDSVIYLFKSSGEAVDLKNINNSEGNMVSLPKTFIEDALKNKSGSIDLTLDGVTKTVSYGYIVEKDWIYAVAVTKSSYLRVIYKLQLAILISGILSVLIAVLLTLLGTKEIISGIKTMHKTVSEAGKGNLALRNKRVKGGPELKELALNLNTMLENFESSIKEINTSINELTISSNELIEISSKTDESAGFISNITQKMAEGTQNQQLITRSINEETDRVINTISYIINKIKETDSTSKDMMQTVSKGLGSITELNEKIKLIEDGSRRTLDYLIKLDKRSEDIDKIADTIKSISAQTKLLSFNASIEAAKAGEFGQGFNVVAGEIHKLAQISAQSAFEVGEIIKMIHSDTNQVIQCAEDGMNITHDGKDISDFTGEAFRDILDKVSGTRDCIVDIANSAANISEVLHSFISNEEKITDVLINTAQNCQEVAATAEDHRQLSFEISASAVKLQEIADKLNKHKSNFKTA